MDLTGGIVALRLRGVKQNAENKEVTSVTTVRNLSGETPD